MSKRRKTMEELRREYQEGGFIEEEMARRQAVVKENLERRGLTLHKGTALAKADAAEIPQGAPTAFTVGAGSEIRIGGVPHILVKPGPGAGTWYNTEGELIDVHGAVQSDSLDTAAHRENPGDAKAKEVYERDSSAETMRKLSARIHEQAAQLHARKVQKRIEGGDALGGFIKKPKRRLALPKKRTE